MTSSVHSWRLLLVIVVLVGCLTTCECCNKSKKSKEPPPPKVPPHAKYPVKPLQPPSVEKSEESPSALKRDINNQLQEDSVWPPPPIQYTIEYLAGQRERSETTTSSASTIKRDTSSQLQEFSDLQDSQCHLELEEQSPTWTEAFRSCRKRNGFLVGKQILRSDESSLINLLPISLQYELTENNLNVTVWLSLKRGRDGYWQWNDNIPELLDMNESSWCHWKKNSQTMNPGKECAVLHLASRELEMVDCEERHSFACLQCLNYIENAEILAEKTPALNFSFWIPPLRWTDTVQDDNTSLIYIEEGVVPDNTYGHLQCLDGSDQVGFDYYFVRDGLPLGSADTLKSLMVLHSNASNVYKDLNQLVAGTYWCEAWVPGKDEVFTSNKIFITHRVTTTVVASISQEMKLENLEKLYNFTSPMWVDEAQEWVKKLMNGTGIYVFWWKFLRASMHEVTFSLTIWKNHPKNVMFPYLVPNAWLVDKCKGDESKVINGKTKQEVLTTVRWPMVEAGNITASHPHCLNHKMELITRKCVADSTYGARWVFSDGVVNASDGVIVCSTLQSPFLTEWSGCPPLFEKVGPLCVTLTSKTDQSTALATCYRKGAVATSVLHLLNNATILPPLQNYLRKYDASSFWVDSKRAYEKGPYIYAFPGDLRTYGTLFSMEQHHLKYSLENHESLNDSCVVLNILRKTLTTVECSSLYRALCIIPQDKIQVTNTSCPVGSFTATGLESCLFFVQPNVSVTWSQSLQICTSMGLQLIHKNSIQLPQFFSSMTNYSISKCPLGMKRHHDQYVWISYDNSTENVDEWYFNWWPKTDFTQELGGVQCNDGKWFLLGPDDVLDYVVCEASHVDLYPRMSLKINDTNQQLILAVYNEGGLYSPGNSTHFFCFTDAEGPVPTRLQVYALSEDDVPPELIETTNKSRAQFKRSLPDHSRTPVGKSSIISRHFTLFNPKTSTIYNAEDTSHNQKQNYFYRLENKGDGYYWCVGYNKVTFDSIRTEKVLLRTPQPTYAVLIDCWKQCPYLECKTNISCMNFSPTMIRDLRTTVRHTTGGKLRRILNHGNNKTSLLLHLNHQISYEVNRNLEINSTIKGLQPNIARFINAMETSDNHLNVRAIRSVDECPEGYTQDPGGPKGALHWPRTSRGLQALPQEICFNSSNLPVIRHCVGDYNSGAYWEEPTGLCVMLASPSSSTLLKIANTKVTEENVGQVTRRLSGGLRGTVTLAPADIHTTAMALDNIAKYSNFLRSDSLQDVAAAMNTILVSEQSSISQVQKSSNTATKLLKSFDTILEKMSLDDNPRGAVQSVKSRIAVQVVDPQRSDISGIMILPSTSKEFNQNNVVSVTSTTEQSELTKSKPQVAVQLPNSLLRSRQFDVERLAFAVFNDERAFGAINSTQNTFLVNSRVLSISLKTADGRSQINLENHPVEMIFHPQETRGGTKQCVFWDFTANHGVGNWSTSGCTLKGTRDGCDICECTHLTHFAEIITSGGNSYGSHQTPLDIISIVGCSLSLFGAICLALTAIMFSQWRNRLGNKVLLNLAAVIALNMILLLLLNTGLVAKEMKVFCISVGVLLHYSILATFCWMLVSASLQFLRFVTVFNTRAPHFLLKGALFGWGVPLIPIIIVLSISPSLYLENDRSFCYLEGIPFYTAILTPVAIIIALNLGVFYLIMYYVSCGRAKNIRANQQDNSERKLILQEFRLGIVLFFLLGLSWIFGLLAVGEATIVFSYLFCITATLQGFFLFVFFVLWEKNTRKMWQGVLQTSLRRHSDRTSSTLQTSIRTGKAVVGEEVAPLRQRPFSEITSRDSSTTA